MIKPRVINDYRSRYLIACEGFALINVSTTLLFSNWGATLFVCNIGYERGGVTGLFTEAYKGSAQAFGYFGNKQFLSLPRTVGVSLKLPLLM